VKFPEASPVYSIVIPTYNRAGLLHRALDSVANQTFRDFEVIVGDNGSTDDTKKVVDSFTQRMPISYTREENWGGPARPRNNGINAATGEWVCFLDSDDWWHPEKLTTVFDKRADADVIFHDCDIFSPHGKKMFRMKGRFLDRPVFVDLLTGWNPLITSTTCIRKEVLGETGGFTEDKSLIGIEDFDLWLRIARVSDRFVYLPRPLGAYWEDGDNYSRFSSQSLVRERTVFETYAPLLPPDEQQYAERMICYRSGLIYWHIGRYRESRKMFRLAIGARLPRHRLLVWCWLAASGLMSLVQPGDKGS
jgi:glycosyltransferase involved in cell wall biosynthesis